MEDTPPEGATGAKRWLGLAALSALVFLVWYVVLGDALSDDPIGIAVRGGVGDWLMVKEGWAGENAYATLSELAEKWLDLPGLIPNSSHPRPPSAIAALLPIGVIPSGDVMLVLTVIMAICLVVTIDLWASWLGFSVPLTWAITLVVGTSRSIVQGVAWGTHIPLVALCIAIFVIAPYPIWRPLPPVLGGVAVGLKLFPALLVLTRAKSDPKRFLLAASTVGVLTLVGLILPGVGLGQAWTAITGASAAFAGTDIDMSLAAQLGIEGTTIAYLIPLAAIGLVPLLWRIEDVQEQVALALILMLLAAPMAWPEYQLLALPAAMVLWQRSVLGKVAAAIWLAVLAITLDGRIQFWALVALAIALLYEMAKSRSTSPSLGHLA